MSRLLYLTENRPSRQASREFTAWLQEHYPECSFVEVNVAGKAQPQQNRGRYQGRVEGPEGWVDVTHAPKRQAVFDAARKMLAD